MENQKDQQEQTLSQESLQSLEEEQLQDVTGGGWEKVLACFTCGAFQQRPTVGSQREHLLAPLTVDSHQDHPLTRSNSLGHSPSDSPILGVVSSSPVYGLVRSASMPAK